MEVQLAPKAVKEFRALPGAVQALMLVVFEKLESDPFNLSKELRTKKLSDGRFSLRVNRYRAIYRVDNDLIMVTVIRHRRDAYR